MSIHLDLSGQVVLVTGGTRGVGRGVAQRFLDAGATVVVCARRETEPLPVVGGNTASFVMADVRDPEAVDGLIGGVVADYGRLDVVVNNAGGSPPAEAATASPRFSAAIIDLNLTAALHVAQRANAQMQGQSHGGCIVNIASVSGVRPSPGTAVYGAAKAGLLSLTGSLAVEWAPKVRVNALAVGPVRTELSHLHYGDEAGIAAVDATVPLGRMALPEDVGDVAVLLSCPLASYVTGAQLLVHGGGERPAFLDAAKAKADEPS